MTMHEYNRLLGSSSTTIICWFIGPTIFGHYIHKQFCAKGCWQLVRVIHKGMDDYVSKCMRALSTLCSCTTMC